MVRTTMACVFAWFLPGGGHFFLGRWGRGITFLGVILFLFAMGLFMDGRLFSLEPGFFGFLKFFADAATGALYLLGKALGWGHGNITSSSYEYGNTYIYTAGLLNMLLVVDTFDIARGRKQ